MEQSVQENLPAVRDAVTDFIAFQSQLNAETLSTFVEATTASQERFALPSTQLRMQPGTELGRPLPVRYREAEYTMSFPIQKAFLALGQTYEQRVKRAISNLVGLFEAVALADGIWMREHALAALFYNGAGWIHDDPDDDAGELTILGLANGDGQQYVTTSGSSYLATDNHYQFQAGDIVTATDPIPTLVDDLTEHPDNTGDVVVLVSNADKAKYRALGDFYPQPDPNLTAGINVVQFQGGAPTGVPGEFLGYHESGAYLYAWRVIPANYMVAYTTGSTAKPVRMRQHPEALLQGFKPEDDRADYPFYEIPYVRRAGFGGWNRVGAVVKRANSGSYSPPANLTPPIP